MADETRMLRNAQANLIAIQSARIARLEVQLELALNKVAALEAEKKLTPLQPVKGVQA